MIASLRQLLSGLLIAAMVIVAGAPVVLADAKAAVVVAVARAPEDCAKQHAPADHTPAHHAAVDPRNHGAHTLAQCLEACLDQTDPVAVVAGEAGPVAVAVAVLDAAPYWRALRANAILATALMPTGPPGGQGADPIVVTATARSGAAAILLANHRHRI